MAVIGTDDAVGRQLARYRDAGASDLVLSPIRRDDDALQDVWDITASL